MLLRMRKTFFILVTAFTASCVLSLFKLHELVEFIAPLEEDDGKREAYWRPHIGQAAVVENVIYETTRLQPRGGWAVEARCRGPIDVLFIVHACSRKWMRRAALRDTLFEDAMARRFNWTAVFFVGRRAADPLLDAWLNLEADALGDLVVFPIEDGYRTVSPKALAGMRWVANHCPNAPLVVKIDDDVTVNPFKLNMYLQRQFSMKATSLHCHLMRGQPIFREPMSRYFVGPNDAPMKYYYEYCSGLGVIMTFDVMRRLLRASSKILPHPTDDAYVTGDLALASGIGHVQIGHLYALTKQTKDCFLYGDCIFFHAEFTEDSKLTLDSRFYWGYLVWDRRLSAQETLDLSLRRKSPAYRLAFEESRAAFVNPKMDFRAQESCLRFNSSKEMPL